MLAPDEKERALRQLAKKRKQTRMDGYAALGDYHCGIYECDYVSPWSKSAHNVDAEVMIVGQDWSSEEWMSRPIDPESAQQGYSSRFPTNKNLSDLLKRHFDLSFGDVYATNAFPFIKRGRAQGSIKHKHLRSAAQEFLLPQIEIIQPIVVICLGLATFNAVRAAYGEATISRLGEAIAAPFFANQTVYPMICAVAHTGSFPMNLRGRKQVDCDWVVLRR